MYFDTESVVEFCDVPDYEVYARGWKFANEDYYYCGARARVDASNSDPYDDNFGINGL